MRFSLAPLALLALLAPALAGCLAPAEPPSRAAAELSCEAFVDPPPTPQASPRPPPRLPSFPAPSSSFSRNEFGVPLIEAESTAHAWFVAGYAMAQDRLWQLEWKRRAADGTLSEVYGESQLGADLLTRTRMPTSAQRAGLLAALAPDVRLSLEAHVAGINRWIEDVRADPSRLPGEFVATGLSPRPWTADDAVLVLSQGADSGNETANARLYFRLLDLFGRQGAVDRLGDLVPSTSLHAPPSIPPRELRYAPVASPPGPFPAQLSLLERARPFFDASASVTFTPRAGLSAYSLVDVPQPFAPREGSNAVAVSGAHTVSGAPLLLGGPQVGYETPAVYWEAEIRFPDATWNAFVKPGEPPLLRGRYGTGAFVQTTGYGDQLDLVVLRLDPGDPERYLYGDDLRPFVLRQETFAVADRWTTARTAANGLLAPPALAPPRVETFAVRQSHLGPVVAWDPTLGVALVEHATTRGGELSGALVTLREDLPARSADPRSLFDLVDAQSARITGGNSIAAFADGTIALWHNARVPARPPTYDPRLPRPGDPETEWTKVWAPSCLPKVANPRQGYVVNWNNNPAEGWSNMDRRPWLWGDSHRWTALDGAVREAIAQGPLDAARLNALYEDVSMADAFADAVLPRLLLLASPGTPATAQVADWLSLGLPIRDEDDDGRVDHPGLAAYETWREILQERIFGDELGPHARVPSWGKDLSGSNNDDHGTSAYSESVLLALLRGDLAHGWWDDVATPERETAADVVAASLADLDARLAERFGPSPEDWRRPMARIHYTPRGLGPELSMPQQNRGSINYIADFGDGSMRTVVPPGQSGHVALADALGGRFGRHVSDQLDPYVRFDYKPASAR
ncbi:MAG TPA: penicillin acylase family protein [Candidatus Thermoplasmatota archaeon]|nr:penicillin acylase family protein [Candidatus Thermoplasmatota archaeon]